MRGNMPCWTKIYAIFWDRGRACFLEKNPKHRNIYKSSQCCALDFFSAKHSRSRSRVLDFFFQDSRIRVKFSQGAKTNLILGVKSRLNSFGLEKIWKSCFKVRFWNFGKKYFSSLSLVPREIWEFEMPDTQTVNCRWIGMNFYTFFKMSLKWPVNYRF